MTDEVVIKVENLWKQYGLLLPEAIKKLGQCLADKRSYSPVDHWALRGINFEVNKGETLGIIGPNGAGKSTLLKVLAGVTPATRGKVRVKGKIFPMIELNAGIHPELTGRENVHLLGAIMGISRQVTVNKMPEIEEFTELGEWFDKSVRMYSSGMLARLGFGVAVNVDADILLIDEILAVGDLIFQFKCHQRIAKLRDEGKIILFVSHNLNAVRNLCNRVMLLQHGAVLSQGDTEEVVSVYRENATDKTTVLIEPLELESDSCRILDIEFFRLDGTSCGTFEVGDGIILRVHYLAHILIREPAIVVGFSNMMDINTVVTGFNTWEDRIRGHELSGHGSFDLRIDALNLMPATYFVNVVIHTAERYPMIARSRCKYKFRLVSENKTFGIARLDHSWDIKSNNGEV